jgi:hypothetical protein
MEVALRAHQAVLVPGIERCDVADQVPDVRPDPKLIDLPDVDRNSHTL